MSHFYGTLQGSRGQATRCGTKNSGMEVVAASWNGAVRISLHTSDDGTDYYTVVLDQWRGAGEYQILAQGVIGLRNPHIKL